VGLGGVAAGPSARLAAVQPKRLPHAVTAEPGVVQAVHAVQMVWAQRACDAAAMDVLNVA